MVDILLFAVSGVSVAANVTGAVFFFKDVVAGSTLSSIFGF